MEWALENKLSCVQLAIELFKISKSWMITVWNLTVLNQAGIPTNLYNIQLTVKNIKHL
jgi:hypothetical protein